MSLDPKIKSMQELALVADRARAAARRVVHCHGVFDLLHIGHIRYLQKARQLGDLLIVTLTPDAFVNKGPHRPAFTEALRAQALAALDCVDYVAVNQWPTAVEAIALLKPAIYAKGAEFRDQKTPELLREEQAAREAGSRVEFVEEITSSSSQLINSYLGIFPDEVEAYLAQFKRSYALGDVLASVKQAAKLNVLVVGEAIIDEHYACAMLGSSMKAPIIAARYQSHERYAGGALAVANHLAAFCGSVSMVAMLGSENSEEDWIRAHIAPSVQPTFFQKNNSPTIVKRRYRESYFSAPLFEVNYLSQQPLSAEDERTLCDLLEPGIGNYDAVVVADYGHTMLSDEVRRLICDKARFVAVNPQVNAANVGYQTVSKYPCADYVVLAQQELELECRDRSATLQQMVKTLCAEVDVGTVSVTLGKRGCLCYNCASGYCEAPALATRVVDRTGAGDAFYAVTALGAVLDWPLDLLAFLGNVAGAEAVSVVGNSRSLEPLPFARHIESLLK